MAQLGNCRLASTKMLMVPLSVSAAANFGRLPSKVPAHQKTLGSDLQMPGNTEKNVEELGETISTMIWSWTKLIILIMMTLVILSF